MELEAKMKKILIIILIVLFLIPVIYAVQPTQQSNKIFLQPFYRASMTAGTNYTYNITINPPDGISEVKTAILNFDLWMTPTITFNVWVNNRTCNNPAYTISTTFGSSGRAVVLFDCSNVITKAGTYQIIMRTTSANTGASTAWLDLTYMNNPQGILNMMGTEYSPNDPATMFLQLKDSYGNPVINGACFLDIWYPLNASNQHPYTIQDAPMLIAIGDDGMYYYDMTAPSQLGVYMLSAKCSYSFNWQWYYPETEMVFYPTEEIITGTWQGGGNPQVLNSRTDGLYERCDGTLAQPCSANYTFNLSAYGAISNITKINAYFSGQTDTNARILTMSYYNGTSFVNLANTLTFTGTGATTPSSYDEFLTNSVPLASMRNNTIKLRLTTAGSTRVFQNWLTLALLSSSGTIQDLKGSSEMHITNIPNATTNQLWAYSNRTLTYYPETSLAGAQAVWNYTNRNLTYYEDKTNYTRIQNDTWNYQGNVTTNLLTQITSNIWNYVARYVHGVLV
jgi:hypothetical protein